MIISIRMIVNIAMVISITLFTALVNVVHY
jgi:hypothetical protein